MQKKITKEDISKIVNDIYNKTTEVKDRKFNMKICVNNQEQADNWIKNFDNLMKKEFNKQQHKFKDLKLNETTNNN